MPHSRNVKSVYMYTGFFFRLSRNTSGVICQYTSIHRTSWLQFIIRCCRGRDCMVVGFITTYPISAYHPIVVSSNHTHSELYSIKHCDKVCQQLAAGRWFSPISSTNETDHHDITEILLTVALNTINQPRMFAMHETMTPFELQYKQCTRK